MKINLTKYDIDLIGRALMTLRWQIENTEGQNSEFHDCASLADRLACNHNGGTLEFLPPNRN